MRPLVTVGIMLLAVASLWAFGTGAWSDSSMAQLAVTGTLALSIVSFGLAWRGLPRVHGKSVAVGILVVGLLLVPIGVVLTPPVTGCLGLCGPNENSPIASGIITIPLGSGNGTLTVQVYNINDSGSVTAVSLTNQGLQNVTTIPNVGSLVLMYRGNPVSGTNPLPAGGTATGSIAVANVTAGAVYDIACSAIFQNGGSHHQVFSIMAQD